MKKVIIAMPLALILISVLILSCSKKEPAPAPAPAPVTSCFSDSYNGSYTGSLIWQGIPHTNSQVTLTKLSCVTAKLESSVFTTISINSLTASANGAYKGLTSTNDSISLALSGNTLTVSGPLSFSGSK